MPTRRGLILFLAGLALFVSGRFLALSELATVGIVLMAIVVIMIATVWLQMVRGRLVRLKVERLHPVTNVFANEPFPITLRAVGTSRHLPHCIVTEAVITEAPGLTDESVAAGRSLSARLCSTGDLTYERVLPRGLHQLGPGRISIPDQLGMAVIRYTAIPSTVAHVWPQIADLDTRLVTRLFELSATSADSDPGDLREYVVGDDLRHVHWPSSARVDRLIVRDRENARRADRTNVVIADISATSNARDFELVLSVAASLLFGHDPYEQVALVLVGPSGQYRHDGVERSMAALCRAVPDREARSSELEMLEFPDTGVLVATDETVVPVNAPGPVIRCSGRSAGSQQEGTYTVFRVGCLDRLESELDQVLYLPTRNG